MDNTNLYLTITSAILGSNVLNGLISHMLYNRKLNKELKSKGTHMIANEIQKGLMCFRDMELYINTQEIYKISEELVEHNNDVNMFEGEAIYPEIFNDYESYSSFLEKVRICRKEHEKNFTCEIALYLVFIERYLCQLSIYMSEFVKIDGLTDKDVLPVFGTIFIFDLQSWQRKIDTLLVKELNKYNPKLESHSSKKWNKLRKKVLIEQWEDTIFYAMKENDYHKYKEEEINKIKSMVQVELNEILIKRLGK